MAGEVAPGDPGSRCVHMCTHLCLWTDHRVDVPGVDACNVDTQGRGAWNVVREDPLQCRPHGAGAGLRVDEGAVWSPPLHLHSDAPGCLAGPELGRAGSRVTTWEPGGGALVGLVLSSTSLLWLLSWCGALLTCLCLGGALGAGMCV